VAPSPRGSSTTRHASSLNRHIPVKRLHHDGHSQSLHFAHSTMVTRTVCINPIQKDPGSECLICALLPKRDCEPLRTDFAHDPCHCFGMKKKRNLPETERTTIASVEKEMQMPRSTESVRNDWRYQAGLTAEKVAGAENSLSRRKVSDER
jgi:hypothetical protein